ncbi:MAG: c-type cytochrome [Fuerstiella sp.]
MTVRLLFACCLLVAFSTLNSTLAELPTDRVIVPGYERFRAQQLSQVEAGNLLLSELNCTSCHQPSSSSAIPTRSAPVLTDVANRIQPEHLQQYIADPFGTKPGTAMPQVLHGQTTEQQAKAITHFLANHSTVIPTAVSTDSVKKGQQLFHSLGCAACHGDLRNGPKGIVDYGMPLGTLHEKYSFLSLTAFLKDPHAVRPSGRMPSLNLTQEEAGNVASYLLRETKADPVMQYEYFEGSWENLPDFSTLKAKTTGYASQISISVAERDELFAIRFQSNLHIRKGDKYKFWLTSDDASRLLIDGEEIIRHDGVHAASTKTGEVQLSPGPHAIVVEYCEWHGQEELSLELSSKELERQPLNAMLSLSDSPQAMKSSFEADPTLVKQGATLFQTVGCASCHQHAGLADSATQSTAIATKPTEAKALAALNGNSETGCLTRAGTTPRFQLSKQQVDDLKAALTALQKPDQLAATKQQQIRSTLLTLNCYACHGRDEMGGIADELNHVFTGTVPEMGDEARIPPTLTNVGDKLQQSWMTQVLNEGAKNRPYMKTRMPRFGKKNVGDLVQQFATLDQRTEIEAVTYEERPHRILAAGRYMVGDQALSCIKCHSFGKYKATGVQSLDMTTMTSRLRRDWFHRYLVNPQEYRKGTRMPAAWPRGRSILRNVLDSNTPQQIQAIWDYLEQGDKAAIPSGLEKKAIVLKPTERPMIYRNFIEGLSPRGIAVGHREKVHYAWDAHDMNLKLIWHNQFIDASKHWVGRGQGFQSPLGDHVMNLAGGIPFATLESLDVEWPKKNAREAGFRFIGYNLNEQGHPTFKYSMNDIDVTDLTVPLPAEPDSKLTRTITLSVSDRTQVPDNLYFRIAAGNQLEKNATGVRVGSVSFDLAMIHKAVLRTAGSQELLAPIQFDSSGKATISYQMSW